MNLSAQKHRVGAVSWQIRVYEALFLIGNKKLLFDLGVDDEDAERKFRGGLQIKAERRILFKLCQELEINDQARLVKLFKVHLNNEIKEEWGSLITFLALTRLLYFRTRLDPSRQSP